MSNRKRYSFIELVVLALFIITPFVMSFDNIVTAEILNARTLPSYISTISGYLRWFFLSLLTIFSFFSLTQNRTGIRINRPVILFSLFYFIQFTYALVDGFDILRFFLLTIFSLLIPPAISYVLYRNKNIIKLFVYFILGFLILSYAVNGHLILNGVRFLGFVSSQNEFGFLTVFWMTVLLIAKKEGMVKQKMFIFLFATIIISMFLSGTRTALIGIVIVIFFNYSNKLIKYFVIVLLMILLIFIMDHYFELNFLTERFLNISNSVEDSGRINIWIRAFPSIKENFWWGNGMDANEAIAHVGNMHNCYLRFMLNMGMFFTTLSLLFYFSLIVDTIRHNKTVPFVLSGYLIAFALMNIGEDFFVGVGATDYICTLFIFGFINYYWKREKKD